jgi:hypothetical protein
MEKERSYPRTDEQAAWQGLPPLRLPDAASIAGEFLNNALEYCAEKMRLGSPEMALELLRQGDSRARWHSHHSLAAQVAETLGHMDQNVNSVFVLDYDATPEDLAFGEPGRVSPIHLIVRAERKTEALNALIGALESALVRDYAVRIGPRQLKYLLDVQVIDAEDVEKRRGYAALLTSLYNRPIRVWER